MQNAFFISDAHLGLGTKEEERAKERRLVDFLISLRSRARYLFIVGDLFDAWFEYRTVVPKGYYRLFTALEDLRNDGAEIHYLAGNHDFWVRDFFTTDLGIVMHREPWSLVIDGKRILLHHGDGLALNDRGYAILKPILRNPLSVWLYTWLHPDLGIPLARGSSQKSRQFTTAKHYGEEDGMRKYAADKIREGYDIVVMGHRHEPQRVDIGSGVYINLGDWITHNTYAELSGGAVELKTWNGRGTR